MQDTKYDMAFMEEPSLKDKELAETEETLASAGAVDESMPVSYTHLTLPTT